MNAYQGHERRTHRVYVTGNSEYHVDGDVCVAVKNLVTGAFLAVHPALGKTLVGGLRFGDQAALPHPSRVEAGDCLCFESARTRIPVVTSQLKSARRPSKRTVMAYPRKRHAGG